jgi:RecB family exonuclease
MDTFSRVFSVSQLKTYQQCGLKYKFSKIDKLTPLPTSRHHLWLGSLVHNSIYAGLGTVEKENVKNIKLYKKPSVKKALKMFDILWESSETQKDPIILDIIKSIGERPTGKFLTGRVNSLKSTNQSELEFAWKELAKSYVENGVKAVEKLLKNNEIVEIERELHFEVLGRKFVGYIDILFKDKKTNELTFIDFKTSWDKPAEFDVNSDLQFLLYSHALISTLNLVEHPKGSLVHLKSGDLVNFTPTTKGFQNMFKTIKNIFSNMESNVFFDNYGHPFCKSCEFRNICYGNEAI